MRKNALVGKGVVVKERETYAEIKFSVSVFEWDDGTVDTCYKVDRFDTQETEYYDARNFKDGFVSFIRYWADKNSSCIM